MLTVKKRVRVSAEAFREAKAIHKMVRKCVKSIDFMSTVSSSEWKEAWREIRLWRECRL